MGRLGLVSIFVVMILIDTHTHLYSDEFSNDRHEMIQRAIDANVKHFMVPSIDSSYASAMYALEASYVGNVHLMMGLHPCYVKENYKDELTWVHNELQRRPFVAIGEIGIDLFWDKSTLKWQQDAFLTQIRWAKQMNLPINIHCRDAFDETFEILESEKSPELTGIFHCFTGDFTQAKRAIDCGMKLGVGGVVTFKNGRLDTYLNDIDLKNVVLETDAPYLAPVPFRGKRNESSYVKLVAEKLATIYNISVEEVALTTSQNARDVFRISL